MYDDNTNEEEGRYGYQPPSPAVLKPGDPGYRMLPWSPDYMPGENWNDGTAPSEGSIYNISTNQWQGGAQPPAAPTPTAPPPAQQAQPVFQQPQTPSSYRPPDGSPQAPPPSVKQPAITDEVTKMLMARLNELKNPGDVQGDPIYQQAVRSYQVGQLRSADKQRKALAERSAAGGTRASGGFNVGVQGINERAGENASQYRSGLALDRLSSRESQLVEAIKMARAVGQDDIANQLELQRLQLQQELGRGDLQLRGELGRGQLGLGYDNLGFNYADMVTRANRDATLAALGGNG